MGYYDFGYVFVLIAFVVTLIADILLRSRYSKYKKVAVKKEITGAEVAREILKKNGLENVYVVETKGVLSDHYDPGQKVVRLSKEIYEGSSIAAVSVAAHECGHAIQDKENYTLLKLRSLIVPLANFGTKFGYIAVLIGILFQSYQLAWTGVFLLCFILIFQLITLPVELDASKRAEGMLSKLKLVTASEGEGVNKMLTAAALTYVASLLSTIFDLLRLVLIIISNSDD